MDSTNLNENQTSNTFDEESEKRMEKQVKLSFIASIALIVASLLGGTYSTILVLVLAYFNVNAIKVERFKKDATRNLILLGAAVVITIIRVVLK